MISPDVNIGRKQSPKHVARRMAAVAATKAQWSAERLAAYKFRVSEANKSRSPDAIAKMTATRRAQKLTPWNKGNNWRHKLSADEVRAVVAMRMRKRRSSSVSVKINDRMTSLMRHSLKNGAKAGRQWKDLAGYSVSELMQHLESRFVDGMSWSNISKWHIDHVRPRAAFVFTSTDEQAFKECWAISNLQPLWAVDNLKKGARHFQES